MLQLVDMGVFGVIDYKSEIEIEIIKGRSNMVAKLLKKTTMPYMFVSHGFDIL